MKTLQSQETEITQSSSFDSNPTKKGKNTMKISALIMSIAILLASITVSAQENKEVTQLLDLDAEATNWLIISKQILQQSELWQLLEYDAEATNQLIAYRTAQLREQAKEVAALLEYDSEATNSMMASYPPNSSIRISEMKDMLEQDAEASNKIIANYKSLINFHTIGALP